MDYIASIVIEWKAGDNCDVVWETRLIYEQTRLF